MPGPSTLSRIDAPGVGSALRSRWPAVAVISAVVVAGTYLAAVWTARGQALENSALRGADQVTEADFTQASDTLGQITVFSLGAALVLVAIIAVARRCLDLAFAAVAVIVLGQIIAQGLKRFILPRPALVQTSGHFRQNTFPSGHTTIAISVLFAAIIVVPYRWRGAAMLLMLFWACGIGAYTITAKWHRFSDTLGADAVALLCGCLATWWLARRGAITAPTESPHIGRIILTGLLALGTTATLTLGAILWGVPLAQGVDLSRPDPTQDYTAYLGAHSLAVGFSGLAALVFWGLWHRLETLSGSNHRRSGALLP